MTKYCCKASRIVVIPYTPKLLCNSHLWEFIIEQIEMGCKLSSRFARNCCIAQTVSEINFYRYAHGFRDYCTRINYGHYSSLGEGG